MQRFLKFLIFIMLISCSHCYAEDNIGTIGVLSGDGSALSPYYYIYPDAANMFAQDAINAINKGSDFKAVNLYETNKAVTAKNMNNGYQKSYIVDLPRLQKINKAANVDYILMITCGLDIQNYVMKGTWWNFFAVPGADVIDPKYNLITYVSLVDMSNNAIVWQNVYEQLIGAKNFNIMTVTPSPSFSQLKEIKKYSNTITQQMADNAVLYIKNPPMQDSTFVRGTIVEPDTENKSEELRVESGKLEKK